MSTQKWSTVAVMGFVSLALLTGYSRSSGQEVAHAKANVVVVKQDLQYAAADDQPAAQQDWQTFKNEAEANIAANEKSIAVYKARMTTADGKLREKYDKRIDTLEERNEALKEELENYGDGGKDKSEQFKHKFRHDMSELGTTLRTFTHDNTKAAQDVWLNFKNGAEDKLEANEKIIANYRAKMTTAEGKLRAQYDTNMDKLEDRNNALKEKLEDYKDSGKNKSEQFKRKFDHDLHALGTALKNFVDDDEK